MSVPQEKSKDSADPGWVVFKEWLGGSERKQTEKFKAPAKRWRVSWNAVSGDPIGTLTIHVRNAKDEIVALALNLQGGPDRRGLQPGYLVVRSSPDEHYLEIESAGINWHVAVEHER